MPARGIGYYGTEVIRRPRTVKAGGRIRFNGLWYQSDALIPHVGERVMFDCGLGFDGAYPVTECWTERIVDARWARKTGRKRQHRTAEGAFICHAHLENDPSNGRRW